MIPNKLSREGQAFLVHEEGLRLTWYKDNHGFPTIGVGHLLTAREQQTGRLADGTPWKNGLTHEQALTLFASDSAWAEHDIATQVHVPLTQPQFDALVSFVFNVGDTNLLKSSLLRLLNQGKYTAVPLELQRWVFSGGMRDQVLTARRKREADLWNSA